jgi:hypothetical protein
VDERGKASGEDERLSRHRFRSNQVRLALSLLAYNLGNLWRRLALLKGIENWSLTSLQQRLVKTGGRTGETCPLLQALAGGEPPDETVVWQYAPADRQAVASSGIAKAVGAGKSIQSKRGTERCLTKPDGKSCGQQFRDSRWGRLDPVPRPGPGQRE